MALATPVLTSNTVKLPHENTLETCCVSLWFFYTMSEVTGFGTSLGAAEGGHVFGLFAGNTPVVGLVDGFVMFPGGFVVHGKPLDGLGGQSLWESKQHVIINGIQE